MLAAIHRARTYIDPFQKADKRFDILLVTQYHIIRLHITTK